MVLWFVGSAVVTVWYVFRDPAFDYRLLIVGSLLPALLDAPFGGARAAHSLSFSAALLAIVMLATPGRAAPGRRRRRRALLGLPVGTLLHLVFTGAWTNQRVFWWPFGGWGFGAAEHPVVVRGWWNVALELSGLALCIWVARRAGLGDRRRRVAFWRTGQLELASR